MNLKESDCTTAATCHPSWNGVRDSLSERFAHCPELEKWAIDFVSAHLMGVPDRSSRSRQALGPIAANDVIVICRGYGIDIGT